MYPLFLLPPLPIAWGVSGGPPSSDASQRLLRIGKNKGAQGPPWWQPKDVRIKKNDGYQSGCSKNNKNLVGNLDTQESRSGETPIHHWSPKALSPARFTSAANNSLPPCTTPPWHCNPSPPSTLHLVVIHSSPKLPHRLPIPLDLLFSHESLPSFCVALFASV